VATSCFVVGGAGTARAVQGVGGGFQRPRVPLRIGRAHGAQGRQAVAGQGLFKMGGEGGEGGEGGVERGENGKQKG
jgi:hypothetical protein